MIDRVGSNPILRSCCRGAQSVVAAVWLLASPVPGWAQSTAIFVSDLSGRVGTVDITTGVSTLIGSSGVQLLDIAVTETGAMWGVDGNYLYSLNRASGAATTVGALGDGYGLNALVGQGGRLLGASGYTNLVYRLNPGTGAATALVGSMGMRREAILPFTTAASTRPLSTADSMTSSD